MQRSALQVLALCLSALQICWPLWALSARVVVCAMLPGTLSQLA